VDDPLETVDSCDLALAALVGATDNGDLIVLADGDRADLNDTFISIIAKTADRRALFVWFVYVYGCRSFERNNSIRWSCVGHRVERWSASLELALGGGSVVDGRGLAWYGRRCSRATGVGGDRGLIGYAMFLSQFLHLFLVCFHASSSEGFRASIRCTSHGAPWREGRS
jgi:hypothetical protein